MKQIRDNKNHNGSSTKLYNSWRAMKQRCYDKSQYQLGYQDKGIEVFIDWHRFVCFRDWAMSNGYINGLTIERINIDKGYSPENCKWITKSENSTNRNNNYDYSKVKRSRYIKLSDGELITVRDYSIKNNLIYNTFRAKLNGMGKLINESDIRVKIL